MHVLWGTDASRQLTEILLLAGRSGRSTADIVAMAARLNRELAADPADSGESRQFGVRILTYRRLTVTYEFHPAVPIVFIRTAAFSWPRNRS